MAINYDRITWQNDGVTPLNANNLNRMESGIKDACDGVDWIKDHIGKTLWTGEWSSGSITVPDTDKYKMFIIGMAGMGTVIPAIKNNIYIRGIGGYCASGTAVTTYQFAATFTNNEWSLVACTSEEHTPNSNHSAANVRTVTSIIGLI